MTGDLQKTQFEELNGGRSINETLFYQFLNLFKNYIEGLRPWVILRKQDSSIMVNQNTSVSTANSLPSDFKRPYNVMRSDGTKGALMLKTSGNARLYPTQIQFGRQQEYNDSSGYWYLDLAASKFYLTGPAGSYPQSYTAYLNYICKSADITKTTSWVFPEEYHGILPELVAELQKAGIDYDEINARQVLENNKVAQMILQAMIMWDDSLQRAELGQ